MRTIARLIIKSLKEIDYKIPKHDFLIDCRGFSLEKNVLLSNLINKKFALQDELKLGLITHGYNLEKDWLFTMGALRRADLWEITAVLELRLEAQTLAQILNT